MPRSSDSVAALGCALAKAQAELINPEKSLTATIRTGTGGAGEGEERSFRYASLASGLDIVRKTLSQHELATVQTTAVDPTAGLVNLTTMLVHASGEWIASDWPVCPISDLASPRRMGAALTYARRYALFTLVGIAGEDNLDAPDLHDQGDREPPPRPANGAGNGFSAVRDGRAAALNKTHPVRPGNGYVGRTGRGGRATAPWSSVLTPGQSAELRDRLLAEVAAIGTGEQAEVWARKALPSKNDLIAADAKAVEAAFEQRLSAIAEIAGDRETVEDPPGRDKDHVLGREPIAAPAPFTRQDAAAPQPPPGIDKSLLALPEPKRHRNKEHLRFVAQQPCLVCARTPSDPHHLRFAQARALGRKVSDEFVVPLCRSHHRALHRVGDEVGWWRAAGIDPLRAAAGLWRQTRLVQEAALPSTAAEPPRLRQKRETQKSSRPKVWSSGSPQSSNMGRISPNTADDGADCRGPVR